jgi:ribonuclease HI
VKVTAYTDGAASGNPGPGGYGAILESGKHRRELWGGFRRTTNNRMELLAVIAALEALKKPGMEVTVVSDSKYVIDSVEKGWVFDWEKKNFAKKKNPDLTKYASTGSAGTTGIRRTSCAINWPWRRGSRRIFLRMRRTKSWAMAKAYFRRTDGQALRNGERG